MLISVLQPNRNYNEVALMSDQILARGLRGENVDGVWPDLIDASKRATGRSCAGCNMCCYALSIEEPLHKRAGDMCTHCEPGVGCKIYADRPPVCSGYFCGWLTDDFFGPEWFPADSRILIQYRHGKGGQMAYHFVPDHRHPDRWRDEPYYSTIKRVAGVGLNELNFHTYVIPSRSQDVFLVLPREDINVSDRTHLPIKTGLGSDDWEVIIFGDRADGHRHVAGMQAAAEITKHLSPLSRNRILLEMNRRQQGANNAER